MYTTHTHAHTRVCVRHHSERISQRLNDYVVSSRSPKPFRTDLLPPRIPDPPFRRVESRLVCQRRWTVNDTMSLGSLRRWRGRKRHPYSFSSVCIPSKNVSSKRSNQTRLDPKVPFWVFLKRCDKVGNKSGRSNLGHIRHTVKSVQRSY